MVEFRNEYKSPSPKDKVKAFYKLQELRHNGVISMADMEGELAAFCVAVSRTQSKPFKHSHIFSALFRLDRALKHRHRRHLWLS